MTSFLKRCGAGLLLGACLVAGGAASAGEPATVDIDLVQVDVRNALRLLADVGHVNIVFGDDVGGQITLKLKGVRWERALATLVAVKGLEMERDRNIIRVASAETFAKERAAKLAAKQ